MQLHGELRLLSIYISDRTKENLGECRVNDILRLLIVSRCSNLLIKSLLRPSVFYDQQSWKCPLISWLDRGTFKTDVCFTKQITMQFLYLSVFQQFRGKVLLENAHKENLDWGDFTLVIFFSIIIPVQVNPRPVKEGNWVLSAVTYVIS